MFFSGTSFLVAPDQIASNILATYPKRIECEEIEKLPNMVFNIGNDEYVLEPKDFILKFEEEDGAECVLAVSSMGDNENLQDTWILGDIFLKKYYSIYDMDNLQVGFAQAKN